MFIAALFTIARTLKQPRCPLDRWLDKEGVVHIHNGILLSYKKEHIWVSSNEMDKPKAYYWKRKWQPTPVLLPGKAHGQKSLVGYSPWGRRVRYNCIYSSRKAYYTVKSESQILYINACVWNIERWYWWTYFQGSNGDKGIEIRLVDTVGEGEGGTLR